MPIVLQSTVDFSGEFMRKLPALEKTMIAQGLDPSGFVISKDRATPSSVVPFVGPFFYDYTVFVDGESFTLTEPNDMVFLDYFVKLCTADEEDRPLPKLRRDRINPVRRFLSWMTHSIRRGRGTSHHPSLRAQRRNPEILPRQQLSES